MRESITYQIILEEGREEGRAEGRIEGELRRARRTVLVLGADRFGPADAATEARIQRLDDLDTLDRLIHGVLRAANWQELMALIPDR